MSKIFFLLLIVISLTMAVLSLSPSPVHAQSCATQPADANSSLNPPSPRLDLGYTDIKNCLPHSTIDDLSLQEILASILDTITLIIAVLALFGLIISGIMYITAGGDPEKADRAKKNIIWIVTGIVIYVIGLSILPATRSILQNELDAIAAQLKFEALLDAMFN